MQWHHLVQLLLCDFLLTLTECQTSKQTKIWESAKSKIGSTNWSKAGTWNGKYKGLWKCNLFVHDVLKEATGSGIQILANDWADPNSPTLKRNRCYSVANTRQKGDIIAFKRNRTSGHVGIMSTGGTFISALKHKVQALDVEAFKRGDKSIVSTTVWRYTC